MEDVFKVKDDQLEVQHSANNNAYLNEVEVD